MEFFIRKNSTLPKLMVEFINESRVGYHQTAQDLTGATITFSMIDEDTGIIRYTNLPATIELDTSTGGYTLVYQFTRKTSSKTGRFYGEFSVTNSRGVSILPVRDVLNINITESFADSNACCKPYKAPNITPTPSITVRATETPTNTPTNTPTQTQTPTNTPTQTQTPTNTPTQTQTQTQTQTNTSTQTPTNTSTPTHTPSPTITKTVTHTPSQTVTQTHTPTQTSTITPTQSVTQTPTQSVTPTQTQTPTLTPTTVLPDISISLESYYSAGSIYAGYGATANTLSDVSLEISFIDEIETSGSPINNPVLITIPFGELTGFTQTFLGDSYSLAAQVSSFSGLTVNASGSSYTYGFTTGYTYNATPTPTPTNTNTPTNTLTQTQTQTSTSTPTNTPTGSVTQTPTNTPTKTPTPTTSPIPVTGYGFNLIVLPYNYPASGNSILNNPPLSVGSTDINLLGTSGRGFYFNDTDIDGVNRVSYFSAFTGQNITITFTQTGKTAIYSGNTGSLKRWVQAPYGSGFVFGTNISVPGGSPTAGTAVLIQSATTQFVTGQTVYVSVTTNNPVTPTPTPTKTATNTPTPTPTPTSTLISPVLTNLVLYYDPSNTSSYFGTGTTINDLSGNGLSGTLSNISFTSPYFAYNGSTSQVTRLDNSLLEPGTGDWTMEVWVNQTGATGSQVILGKFDPGGGSQDVSYAIRAIGGNVRADFGNGSTAVSTSNYSMTTGTWYQLTYVFNNVANNNIITYVNGVQQSTTTHSFASILNTSANLYLGSYNGGEYSQYYNGNIGITRLYSSALTSAQVLQNFNSNKSKYGL